jgi:hypothetical protein
MASTAVGRANWNNDQHCDSMPSDIDPGLIEQSWNLGSTHTALQQTGLMATEEKEPSNGQV